MTAPTQVRISLVETREPHQVLRHILAADEQQAAPFIAAWNAFGSTRAGRTRVEVLPMGHPERLPEGGDGE